MADAEPDGGVPDEAMAEEPPLAVVDEQIEQEPVAEAEAHAEPGAQSARVGGSGLNEAGEVGVRGGSGRRKTFEEVDADPTKVRRLSFEQAHMLATMPRNKISDLLQGAVWAVLAAAPGAVGGWMDINKKVPANDKIVDIAGIAALSVSVAFVLFSLMHKRGLKTSEEYLAELYKLPEREPGKIRRWWRDWFGD